MSVENACREVSTSDQNPDHQIDALVRASVDAHEVHLDIASGSKASRPKSDLAMQMLRAVDRDGWA